MTLSKTNIAPIAMCMAIGLVAVAANEFAKTIPAWPFTAVTLSFIVGTIAQRLIHVPHGFISSVRSSSSTILKVGVISLGLQFDYSSITTLDIRIVSYSVAVVPLTILFTICLARALRVDLSLALLLGVGTGICGAAAILATSDVGKQRTSHVAYALTAVTIVGATFMFLYPVIGRALALPAQQFGFWAGSSLHEVANVIGASFEYSRQAGEVGIIVKLLRVVCIIPAVALLSVYSNRHKRISIMAVVPWYIVGFIFLLLISHRLHDCCVPSSYSIVTSTLFSSALGGLGFAVEFRDLKPIGFRPVSLLLIVSVFISGLTLVISQLLI